MAHELEISKSGDARMFYAGKAPWHGLGMQVEKEVTSGAALRFAQLDWEVEKRPVISILSHAIRAGSSALRSFSRANRCENSGSRAHRPSRAAIKR